MVASISERAQHVLGSSRCRQLDELACRHGRGHRIAHRLEHADRQVAADFKDVRFEHATGYKTAANMRTYDSRTDEGAYMAGVIAGKMSKTGTLGVVGSVPIPEGGPQHQQLRAGRAVGHPENHDQGGVGQRVV